MTMSPVSGRVHTGKNIEQRRFPASHEPDDRQRILRTRRKATTRSSTWRGRGAEQERFGNVRGLDVRHANRSQPGLGDAHHADRGEESHDANRQNRQQDVGVNSAVYSCHRNPPTPGVPVSISLATITSHAMPRLNRKPVNMYGSVAGRTGPS